MERSIAGTLPLIAGGASVPPELRERAIEALRRRFGADDWQLLPERKARKSTIVCLRSAAAGSIAALKLYDPAKGGRGQALQCAALERFQPLLAANADGFDLPEVYASFPDCAAMLIEWVPARQLEQVLVRAGASPRAHWRAVALAGQWLRRLHEASGFAEEPFAPARYAELLQRRMAAQPEAASLLGDERLWVAGLRRFERRGAALAGIPVTTAVTHGDFTSTNLLIGARRVTGIDLWAERRAPVADDLARMFVYLAMGDLLPLAARFGPVPVERRRAMQALFEGYGRDRASDDDAWRHIVLFEALARWLALSARLLRRGSFSERWKSAGLRRLIAALLRQPD